MRLSTRLSLSYLAFIALLFVLVLGLVFVQVTRLANRAQSLPFPASPGEARAVAQHLAANGLTTPVPPALAEDTLGAGGWIQVVDASGSEVQTVSAPADRITTFTAAQLAVQLLPWWREDPWYAEMAPVGEVASPTGMVILRVPKSEAYPIFGGVFSPRLYDTFIAYFMGGVGLAVLTAVALALLVGFWYARRLARPLVRLSTELKVAAAGDFTHRIPVRGKDEFATLAQAYNHLVERLTDAEQERTRTEEARRDLVANLSHDLRTPLTSIQGFAERLAEPETAPDERQRYAGLIGSRVAQLNGLLGDLLELSRLQALPEVQRAPTDLAELVRETVIAFLPELEQAGLEVEADLPEDLPPVPADNHLIRRALQNLVVNALRHSGGATTLKVGLYRSGSGQALEVRDNGKGIPAEELPHLFDRYYRGTSSTARGRGSGLGLAIVRQIAENHGGRIGVLSIPGQGSTFTLWLPL